MLPDLKITIGVSDALYELGGDGARLWNKIARAAMQAELVKHHLLRIPKHFQVGARGTYQYARRKLSTERKKRRYWKVPGNQDLVRSGRSARRIKGPADITMRGAFGGKGSPGTLQGMLNMYLPYPLLRPKAGGVTPEQIESEIVRFTDAEAQEVADGYLFRLIWQINAHVGPMHFVRSTRGTSEQSRTLTAQYGSLRKGRLGPGF